MDTLKLFEKVKFNVAYISIYSPRKGTPSAKHMVDDIPLTEKKSRHARLSKVYLESKKK